MTAPTKILELVERFNRNLDAYKQGKYNEAQVRKFFLEAKKPSVYIKEDIHPAYQLRRYAWSAGLPLSILTDFEEFAVYDCRIKPIKTDQAATARTLYLTYKENIPAAGKSCTTPSLRKPS